MTPDNRDLWFLPLGGSGEIGMNFNLYGHNGAWLAVDCGITFAEHGSDEPHVQMADPTFISSRRQTLAGLVITHAHEDHVGAVPWLWGELGVPVYTTAFTKSVLERKLSEHGLLGQVPIHVMETGQRVDIGPFNVEWIGFTHSTPETHGMVIRTPAGNIFHTADWKLDADPVVGDAYAPAYYQALAHEDIRAVVCDSTNALVEGRSQSEGALFNGLRDVAAAATGRVVVACFGSNIARLRTLSHVAEATGRYLGLIGRSLTNFYQSAISSGVWPSAEPVINPAHLGYLPRNEVLAAVTGSQGEPRAALDRLAANTHQHLSLEAGDCVVFSSRIIPGNEVPVKKIMRNLERLGVSVVTADDTNAPIHASGHPAREELADLYRWVRPEIAVPVHGEPAHMEANAAIASSVGVPHQLVGRNGDLFMFAPNAGIRRNAAVVGRLGVVDRGLVDLDH